MRQTGWSLVMGFQTSALPIYQAGVPVAAAAVDAQVAVDAIVGDRIEVVVEVLDVALVADPVDVGACLPGPVDVLPAEEAEAPAVVLAAVLQRIAFLDELGQLLVAVPDRKSVV